MIPVLIGVSILVFVLMRVIPGDPATTLFGNNVTGAARAALYKQYGLSDPLPEQYLLWVGHLFEGVTGESIALQVSVGPLVLAAFVNTLLLSGCAAVLAILGGVVLGGIAALRKNRWGGWLSSATSIAFVAAPQYVVALFFVVIFAVEWPVFPSGGIHSSGGGFGDLVHHLVLPVVAAALVPMGIIARQFASSLTETLGQGFVEALRARGIPQRRVVWHAVHETLPALLTISGLQAGVLLGGVLFIETIFSWPGLGLLVYDAITQRDYPVLELGILVWAVMVVLLNAIVDIAHAAMDPRVRA